MPNDSNPGLTPGDDFTPVPSGEKVLRIGEKSPEYIEHRRPSRAAFEPSSEDRKAEANNKPVMISVFAEKLTSPQQARALSSHPEKNELAFRLNVDQIRHLRPTPEDDDNVEGLDVLWEKAKVGVEQDLVIDTRPGAEGHAGISGLYRPRRQDKTYKKFYKSLIEQIIDLAAQDVIQIQ